MKRVVVIKLTVLEMFFLKRDYFPLMKFTKIICFGIVLLYSNILYSQTRRAETEDDSIEIFIIMDRLPTYRGGYEGFTNYFFYYMPTGYRIEKYLQCWETIKFTREKYGNITDVDCSGCKIKKLRNKICKIIEDSPDWNEGMSRRWFKGQNITFSAKFRIETFEVKGIPRKKN
ncbi:hypothetical protein AAG747_27755 [Rapidithrix thailandica]|uniref:Uncharacterized protein n=1 Tax=Rapidithrix thailandica TaxID=413964 RepID=A0AAW9SGX9_9BACT